VSAIAPDRRTFAAAIRGSTDPLAHAANLDGWQGEYEPFERRPYQWLLGQAWLGPLQLIFEHIDGGGLWRGQAWQGCRLFIVNARPRRANRQSVAPDSMVTCRWNGFAEAICPDGASSVMLAVDERWLVDRLSDSTGTEFRFRDDGRLLQWQCDHGLLDRFTREVPEIVRQLVAEPAILESDASRASVQSYAADLLLQLLSAEQSAAAPLPRPSTREYIVDRAMQYAESDLGGAISMFDVCNTLRVTPRTLRYSFESVLGISPNRYLLAMRLNRVHRDLRASPPEVSIQHVATRWGFWHLGRFAKYYRDTFGERPSDTCRADASRRARAWNR